MDFRNLKHLDILFCKRNNLLGKIIRWKTKGEVNHTSLFVFIQGKPFIIEAQAKGVHLISYNNWLKKYKYKYFAYRNKKYDVNFFIENCEKKAFNCLGITGYDFLSLLWYQPRYILTGKWKGKRNENAVKRMYCSEFNAYVKDIENSHKMSPQNLLDYVRKSKEYFKV